MRHMHLLKKYEVIHMYKDFAKIYDRLQDIDYNSFVDYYKKVFEKFDLKPELVLDLACGTGNVTIPLAKCGYDMIGVDLSEEMLDIAAQKAREEDLNILFLNQDMTEFELYGTVDAIVCSLDGVNYLTCDGEVEKLFFLVKNYLNPDGIFIFDINSEYKLKNVLGNNTFVYEEDVYCVWSNCYDDEDKICGFDLDFFMLQENGSYVRHSEYQEERAYSVDELKALAENEGLTFMGAYDDRTFEDVKNNTERIFIILKKEK